MIEVIPMVGPWREEALLADPVDPRGLPRARPRRDPAPRPMVASAVDDAELLGRPRLEWRAVERLGGGPPVLVTPFGLSPWSDNPLST